jgi:DNA-binding XRE family transcriptional regulator
MSAAKLAKAARVSVHTIHSIETREHLPNIRTAERILSALDHELEVVHNGKA